MHPAAPGSRRKWYRKSENFSSPSSAPSRSSDRLSDPPLHFLGFAPQHRRLVGHADRSQMHIGIKAGRVGAAEFVQKRLFVAAVPDVIANIIGVGERKHDKIMTFAIAQRARAGRLGFFVLGFAVNDRGGRSHWHICGPVSKRS